MKDDVKPASDPSEADRSATVPLRKAWLGVVAFYALALALNASSLHRNNEIMPFGPVRSFWMAASGPVARVCAAWKLDLPRAVLTQTAGKALNE